MFPPMRARKPQLHSHGSVSCGLKRRTRGKATPAIGGLTSISTTLAPPIMRGELDKLPKRYEAHRTVRTLSNPSGQLSQNCLAAVQQFAYELDGFFNIFWRHRDHAYSIFRPRM